MGEACPDSQHWHSSVSSERTAAQLSVPTDTHEHRSVPYGSCRDGRRGAGKPFSNGETSAVAHGGGATRSCRNGERSGTGSRVMDVTTPVWQRNTCRHSNVISLHTRTVVSTPPLSSTAGRSACGSTYALRHVTAPSCAQTVCWRASDGSTPHVSVPSACPQTSTISSSTTHDAVTALPAASPRAAPPQPDERCPAANGRTVSSRARSRCPSAARASAPPSSASVPLGGVSAAPPSSPASRTMSSRARGWST